MYIVLWHILYNSYIQYQSKKLDMPSSRGVSLYSQYLLPLRIIVNTSKLQNYKWTCNYAVTPPPPKKKEEKKRVEQIKTIVYVTFFKLAPS